MKRLIPLFLLSTLILNSCANISNTDGTSASTLEAFDLSKVAPAPAVSTQGTAEVTITIGNAVATDPELHDLMLGVISGPEPTGNSTSPVLTAEYQSIGVTSVRNNDYYDDRLDMEGIFNCGGDTYPSWEGCDPEDEANYDWTKSDAQYQSYLDAGFLPFLRVGGEWTNGYPSHDFKGPQNETQVDNWIIAALKMVDRYKNWQDEDSAFTYLNLWTEFPGAQFWDGTNTEFVEFWVEAYQAIKSENPDLKVGGPGFSPIVSVNVMSGKGSVAKDLLTALYNKNQSLDWFGWHQFGTDPTTYAKAAQAYQNLLDGTGSYSKVPWAGTGFFKETEVFTDAYGMGSGSAGSTTPPSVDSGKGAANLTSAWIALQYADIQGAFYYRGNDQSGEKKKSTEGTGEGLSGLFYSDGRYKTSAYAFRLWATLTEKYSTLLSTNQPIDGTATGLWTLAASNESGGVAVLLANPTDKDLTFSITANNKQVSDFENATVYLVDGTHDGIQGATLTTNTITLPTGGVELIELSN